MQSVRGIFKALQNAQFSIEVLDAAVAEGAMTPASAARLTSEVVEGARAAVKRPLDAAVVCEAMIRRNPPSPPVHFLQSALMGQLVPMINHSFALLRASMRWCQRRGGRRGVCAGAAVSFCIGVAASAVGVRYYPSPFVVLALLSVAGPAYSVAALGAAQVANRNVSPAMAAVVSAMGMAMSLATLVAVSGRRRFWG